VEILRAGGIVEPGAIEGELQRIQRYCLADVARDFTGHARTLREAKALVPPFLVGPLAKRLWGSFNPLPEGPDVGLYTVKPESTAAKLEEIVTRWVNDGFCQVDEILILSPHGTKVKTSLSGCSQIGEWPLVNCVIRKPGELSLLSINKAKGLDSLAVIMIDTQSFDKLSSPQQQMDYFMGASRARQLLAILHRESYR
jgi:hypothetical protein